MWWSRASVANEHGRLIHFVVFVESCKAVHRLRKEQKTERHSLRAAARGDGGESGLSGVVELRGRGTTGAGRALGGVAGGM